MRPTYSELTAENASLRQSVTQLNKTLNEACIVNKAQYDMLALCEKYHINNATDLKEYINDGIAFKGGIHCVERIFANVRPA